MLRLSTYDHPTLCRFLNNRVLAPYRHFIPHIASAIAFRSLIRILYNIHKTKDVTSPPSLTHLSRSHLHAWGAVLCLWEASRRVVQGGGGMIVMLTTSVVGGLMPRYAAYAASKAAVETMTKIDAKELNGTGITANCVAPGPIATEMFYAGKTDETVKRIADACPMGRIREVKDVAEVVGFLVGDGRAW